MPKGFRSGLKRFKKCPWTKASIFPSFDPFRPKIRQNTFDMMFNKRTHGFLDIFSSFLTMSYWNIDLLKMAKKGNFGKIFEFENKYLKNYKM